MCWRCGPARGYTLPVDFSNLLEDAGDWRWCRVSPLRRCCTSRAYDDLGPHTGKWDYLAADGSLLACVYRHDTPSGKQYRPWDVRARAMQMPEPRPLYNLPAIAAADAVVLVEGEKCADALMQLGMPATTAMGGAATAIDKTDWTPLAGKTVMSGPTTMRRARVMPLPSSRNWRASGPRSAVFMCRRISPPSGMLPMLWRKALMLKRCCALPSRPPTLLPPRRWTSPAGARGRSDFTGQPQARHWLVEGVFPQAQPR